MASGSYVTIAGIVVPIYVDTGFEDAPEMQGDFVRLGDGSGDNSQRDPKRGFACVGLFDPPSTFDTLQTAISAPGQPGVAIPVPVTSPADGLTRGATLTCYVWAGRAQSKSKGAGFYKTTKLTVPLAIKEA